MSTKTKFSILFIFIFIAFIARAKESLSTRGSYQFLERLVATAKANYQKIKAFQWKITMTENNVKKWHSTILS